MHFFGENVQSIQAVGFKSLKTHAILHSFAAVAQLDRVLGYEPRGRGFDSCQPHQNFELYRF